MKRNKRKKLIDFKNILAILIIVIIISTIVYLFVIKKDKNGSIGSLVKDGAYTIENIILYPFNGICNLIDEYNNLRDVLKENEILKSKIDEIDSINAYNEELKSELDEIKDELNIDYVLSDYEKINATVISRNNEYWYNTLTINKGSKNGVEEGMVVINSKGLVGKVTKVSNFTSDIKLITTTDTNNKISVSINNGESKIYGLISKYNTKNNIIEVEGVSNTLNVNIGDYVYTSGLGGVFPSGILIGKVSSITTDEYDLAKMIDVEPSVDYNDINYVAVLKRSDSNG